MFIGSEALAGGALSRGQLRWNFRAIYPNVYMPKDATPSLEDRAAAAWLWSGRRAVIAGLAAAALHGARGVDDSTDIELIWRCGRPPSGIVVRNERIEADEIAELAGLRVASPERTALDLARHTERNFAVTHLDALARATGITRADALRLTDRYAGAPGLLHSIAALGLMDGGSKSPSETSVRLALIDAGFPAPRTDLVGMAMGYEAPMVGVEFGSGTPRLGWKLIPAANMRSPHAIVYLVRAAVIERGYPPWRWQRFLSA